MTEEQIVKALERCSQHRECCYCNSLEECGSKRVLTVSALELINRQKSTIDELTKAYKSLKSEKNAEIERLRNILGKALTEPERLRTTHDRVREFDEVRRQSESEVIEELLDRAKKRIGDSHFQNYGLAIMEITDVAKEMKGDE